MRMRLPSQGVISDNERIVFESLKAADVDGDGKVTRKEFYTAMLRAFKEVELAKSHAGGIPISALNPDTDGA